jgi:Zinc finger, C2H2 type/C2H2-type zinc finger
MHFTDQIRTRNGAWEDKILALTPTMGGGVRRECRHCGQRVAQLDAHVVVQHPELVTCAVCGESCDSEKALRSHRRSLHVDEKGGAGDCTACGVRVKDLRRHTITKHTLDFPIACSECPKRFVSRSELNSHCRRSHGAQRKEMSLLCKYCGRSFSRKQYLVDHERKHRDERPFECDTCGNTYYSKVRSATLLTKKNSLSTIILLYTLICIKIFTMKITVLQRLINVLNFLCH